MCTQFYIYRSIRSRPQTPTPKKPSSLLDKMPPVKITNIMRLPENSGYLAATLRVNRFYNERPMHLADPKLIVPGESVVLVILR